MNEPASFYIVPHTHWDREWYLTFQDFRRRLVGLGDRLLAMLEKDPSFVHFHFDGQAIVLEDYLEVRPENEARLRRLIRSGRIAVGPWYVLPDEFLVSGESILRNLEIGQRLSRRFGEPTAIGYLPDQFGHISQMPQILALAGIDSAVLWRGVGADITRSEFRWEAPDGSAVFGVFLPNLGYSNGRQLPTDREALRERLELLAKEQADYRDAPPLLVMNGTDHQEPQPELPALLDELRREYGIDAKITTLRAYVDAAQAAHPGPVGVHLGELRSPLRSHLLPGVTSMRVQQKQRDFRNVSFLERTAEPLAAWADRLAGMRDLCGFTDVAWKLAIQNHPHDSICGCSIDAVHQDMEYRFDQVEQIIGAAAKRGLRSVGEALFLPAAGATSVLAYNPGRRQSAVVRLDVQGGGWNEPWNVGGSPLQLAPVPRETVLEIEVPVAMVRPEVASLYNREFAGYFINDIRLHVEGAVLVAEVEIDRVLRGHFDMAAARQRWLALLDAEGMEMVRLAARTAERAEAVFVAPLAAHGITSLSLQRGAASVAPDGVTSGRTGESSWIANEHYRVEATPDGLLRIDEKDSGRVLQGCHRFVDEGDRGDEYNFDALLDPQSVTAPCGPATIRLQDGGPVCVSLTIEQTYQLPALLEADRETRSIDRVDVPIRTTVTVYRDVPRVEFVTEIDNRARDHRLRVLFDTGVFSETLCCEQAFDVVRRSLTLEESGPFEQPIGTVPQKTFSCVEGGGHGVALLNRGIQEIEGIATERGVTLAMTLIRSVGWLSRGDLRMRNGHAGPGLETPGGQSLGVHRFEYALTTYHGDWQSAGIVSRAHDFAYPVTAVQVDACAAGEVSLVDCDAPSIVLSAVTADSRPGGLAVRLYNASDAPVEAAVAIAGGRAFRRVDLLGRVQRGGIRRRGGRTFLRFRPWEIVTLSVR